MPADGQGRTGAAKLLAQARAVGMITCVDLVSSLSDTYAKTVMGTLARHRLAIFERSRGVPSYRSHFER